MSIKKLILSCHPEVEARRISIENEQCIIRFAKNDKKCAFTLAEVLITLGIIGIVAAMTLPTLINKSQQMILKNQFKKSYSVLSQALLKSQVDYGSVPACHYGLNRSVNPPSIDGTSSLIVAECNGFKPIFLKNLNIIQICEDNAYPKGCIPKYKGFDTMAIEQNPDLSEDEALNASKGQPGFYEQKILYESTAYVLSDGTIMFEYVGTPFPVAPQLFAMDINGNKGPNKWGYDLFSFFTAADNKSDLVLIGTGYLVDKGGKTTRQMIRDLYNDKK